MRRYLTVTLLSLIVVAVALANLSEVSAGAYRVDWFAKLVAWGSMGGGGGPIIIVAPENLPERFEDRPDRQYGYWNYGDPFWIRIEYRSPDTVQPGAKFTVEVRISPLTSEGWKLFIRDVGVAVREDPSERLFVEGVVDYRHIDLVGGPYSHQFELDAPTRPGAYYVVLFFKAHVVGYAHFDLGQIHTERVKQTMILRVAGQTSTALKEKHLTLFAPPEIEIKFDEAVYRTDSSGRTVLKVAAGSTHKLEVPSLTVSGVGSHLIFVGWSDGERGNSRLITLDQDGQIEVKYGAEHYLRVNSLYGKPLGEGYYKEGDSAKFQTEKSVPLSGVLGVLGVKSRFKYWSGDTYSEIPVATIKMDKPHFVEAIWDVDYTSLYALLIVTVGLTVFSVLLATRRSKLFHRL